jgi:acetyl coenzyme A synthetase (ADP forming)-like protein
MQPAPFPHSHPFLAELESSPGLLTLRDGTTALVRQARPDDRDALLEFFGRLSPESRRLRFQSLSVPSREQIELWCHDGDPHAGVTLLAIQSVGGTPRIVATGSYLAGDNGVPEVALAVDDTAHGQGLGTLLLERLALLAVRNGYTHFWALVQSDNRGMLEVFRQSGFSFVERPGGGEVEVDLSIIPSELTVDRVSMRHRVATVASLRPFFRPRGVAVIGASRKPESIGFRLLDSLIQGGFPGPIYPVNPQAKEIHGLQAYPSVRDLPDPVDLGVIAVPRDAVLGVVDDCAARGIRAVIVVSAGFAETGPEGAELQRQLLARVRSHGMRLIGPNCLGMVSTDPAAPLNATFVPGLPPAGHVAMSSHSGGLGLAVLAWAGRMGLGISSFVSVGNRADVSSNDLLEYWTDDPNTDVILLYLESFGNPRRFARIVRRLGRSKPVVAVKSGRTSAGSRAAGSHTAALAARDVAVDALFHQSGVLRAETLAEMFYLAAALGTQPLPAGRRVAILTNAGGPGILCADACEGAGLTVGELSAATRAKLATFLPAAASLGNPVDMIASASPDKFGQATRVLLDSGEIDALIVLHIAVGGASPEEVGQAVQESATGSTRPVLACLMPDRGIRNLGSGRGGVPCYAFPEAIATVLGKLADYAEWRAQPLGRIPDFPDTDFPAARALIAEVLARRGSGWLSAEETRRVLQAARLPVAPGGVARTADEAVTLAAQVGFPVAVKLVSRTVIHKTEAGGVQLNVRDEAGVRRAFAAIRDRLEKEGLADALEGVQVQPMTSGVEVLIGTVHDPVFGPLVAFGLGGVYVEILGDVCFRVTPLTDRDAAEMVRGIRGSRLLDGYRGHPAADVEAIQDALLRIGRLVDEVPEIAELDMNPVFALPPGQGCRIVDARIRVASR